MAASRSAFHATNSFFLFCALVSGAYAQSRPVTLAPAIWEVIQPSIVEDGVSVVDALTRTLGVHPFAPAVDRLGFLYLVRENRGRVQVQVPEGTRRPRRLPFGSLLQVANRYLQPRYFGEPVQLEVLRWWTRERGEIGSVFPRAFASARALQWIEAARQNPELSGQQVAWNFAETVMELKTRESATSEGLTERSRNILFTSAAAVLRREWRAMPEEDPRPAVLRTLFKIQKDSELPPTVLRAINILTAHSYIPSQVLEALSLFAPSTFNDYVTVALRMLQSDASAFSVRNRGAQLLAS